MKWEIILHLAITSVVEQNGCGILHGGWLDSRSHILKSPICRLTGCKLSGLQRFSTRLPGSKHTSLIKPVSKLKVTKYGQIGCVVGNRNWLDLAPGPLGRFLKSGGVFLRGEKKRKETALIATSRFDYLTLFPKTTSRFWITTKND